MLYMWASMKFLPSFSLLEIFIFLYYANEESGDVISGPTILYMLKKYNTQSRISSETLEQCPSNLSSEMYITKETE